MSEHISDESKSKQIEEAFFTFCSQFGPNDIYLQTFLEVLMEEMYNGSLSKNRSLWRQLGDSNDNKRDDCG